MATDLTKEAQAGQAPFTVPNPHMYSSPAWMGWEAGMRLRMGYETITKAQASRGYSVRVWTGEAEYLVQFDKHDLMSADIWRKG